MQHNTHNISTAHLTALKRGTWVFFFAVLFFVYFFLKQLLPSTIHFLSKNYTHSLSQIHILHDILIFKPTFHDTVKISCFSSSMLCKHFLRSQSSHGWFSPWIVKLLLRLIHLPHFNIKDSHEKVGLKKFAVQNQRTVHTSEKTKVSLILPPKTLLFG